MPKSTQEQKTASEHYALLHRAVENGEASDGIWERMIDVCVELGKENEAVDAFYQISNPGLRRSLRPILAKRGWVEEANDPDEVRTLMVTDADLNPSVREKLEDAGQFLFERRMRGAVLGGTVAFPVTLVAGGLLTAGMHNIVVQLIALLPALFILGMVGAVARQVLVLAIRGIDDANDLPTYTQLAHEVPRLLVDLVALGVVFLSPGVLLMALGLPWLGLLLLGVAFLLMPMTSALRLTGSEWGRLKPARLLAAIRRTSPPYLKVAGVTALLFAPAMVSLSFTLGMPIFLVISVLGPLAVAPCFMAARMLGLTLRYERGRLGDLFALPGPLPVQRRKPATAGAKTQGT